MPIPELALDRRNKATVGDLASSSVLSFPSCNVKCEQKPPVKWCHYFGKFAFQPRRGRHCPAYRRSSGRYRHHLAIPVVVEASRIGLGATQRMAPPGGGWRGLEISTPRTPTLINVDISWTATSPCINNPELPSTIMFDLFAVFRRM